MTPAVNRGKVGRRPRDATPGGVLLWLRLPSNPQGIAEARGERVDFHTRGMVPGHGVSKGSERRGATRRRAARRPGKECRERTIARWPDNPWDVSPLSYWG